MSANQRDLLNEFTVVDMGQGMATSLVAKFLRECGAHVIRVVHGGDDAFADLYPAQATWRDGFELLQTLARTRVSIDELLANADICILGGEDFPGVVRSRDAAGLCRRYPRLVALEILGYPEELGLGDHPAADILTQARSGLCWEYSSSEPVMIGFKPSIYGATLQGLGGIFAALIERSASGLGQAVTTSLFEGAIVWGAQLWGHAEKATAESEFVCPRDVRPLIFRCSDGEYVHMAFGTPGAVGKLYAAIGIDADAAPPGLGLASATTVTEDFFGDVDLIALHVKNFESGDLIRRVRDAGVVIDRVVPPGDCWEDPQCAVNDVIATASTGVRHVGNPVMMKRTTASAAPRAFLKDNLPLGAARVVDLGSFAAGPFGSVMLGDLGAEVIKVEAMSGDATRVMFRCDTAVNRGKRNIKVDMKTPQGREIVERLCATADLVMNNFRTGVSARLGLDAKALHARYPGVAVMECPAFGIEGPRAQDPGFDQIMQAGCGHEYRAGGIGNPPLWSRTSMVDYGSGLIGSVAALMCLYARTTSTDSLSAYVPLFHGGLFLLSELIQDTQGEFHGAPQLAADRRGVRPQEAIYRTRDGWIAIAVRGRVVGRLAAALGVELEGTSAGWGDDERRTLSAWFQQLTSEEALNRLGSADIWAEPCLDVDQTGLLKDQRLIDCGIIRRAEHPVFGDTVQVGTLFRLSRSEMAAARHAPLAGEDTTAILQELGYSSSDIARFYREKTVA